MKVRILGCGGSFGSPLAWERNGNIDIEDSKNFRTRSSVLINNNNQNILLFPEGTTNRMSNDYLNKFRNGIFRLSFDHNIPIIPVCIIYSKEIGINTDEVMNYKYISFDDLKIDINKNPDQYTVWFKKIAAKVNGYIAKQ